MSARDDDGDRTPERWEKPKAEAHAQAEAEAQAAAQEAVDDPYFAPAARAERHRRIAARLPPAEWKELAVALRQYAATYSLLADIVDANELDLIEIAMVNETDVPRMMRALMRAAGLSTDTALGMMAAALDTRRAAS